LFTNFNNRTVPLLMQNNTPMSGKLKKLGRRLADSCLSSLVMGQ
jgi:hypothetical protein